MACLPDFHFDNTFARDMEGFYTPSQPASAPAPHLLFLNQALAAELGLDVSALMGVDGADGAGGADGAALFAGNALPAGAEPLAQAYAGHQFGGFSPQLGDGRALLLGEVIDRQGQRRDIAFKGSGRTAYSRGGDGRASVGPMLREVLIGEAMHALGIPSTRALAVAATGEQVQREQPLPGAVLTRVAASHIRVGTFQFFSARNDLDRLRRLADYTIARHDPALSASPQPYLALLQAVAERQAALIAQWMNVGFIHGVMNTDNMTLSGETIDYGPCAFMEACDPTTVFSSIDRQGRYAYGNQPQIARWNLARLAEALLPLLSADADEAVTQATEVIDGFPEHYRRHLLRGQRSKLGLQRDDLADAALVDDWLSLLQVERVDFTLAWLHLADAAEGEAPLLRGLFSDARNLDAWLTRWQARCASEDGDAAEAASAGAQRARRMRSVNPRVIPRNHRVEEALQTASQQGDLGPFNRLLDALRRPYDKAEELAGYAEPAPAAVTAGYRTFCGT